MTEIVPGALADTNRLAYSGRAPSAAVQAARARRRGLWYFTEHMLRQMRGYGWPVVVYDLGQPLLYLFAMGVGLGVVVDSAAGSVDGVPYLTFVAPALLVSTAVMTAGNEMTYPVMQGFKWQRVYFGPAASPLSPWQIGFGHTLAVTFRFVVQAAVFWLYMQLFGASASPWSWLVVPIGALSALAFATPLQAYAATLDDEGFQFAFIQRFIVMPMFLFAGTFFELDAMPVYLRWIGWLSPVWHGTELARVASYGRAVPPTLVALHLAFLLALVAVGLWFVRRSYTRRLVGQ